jgi:hypothetical protein
MANEAKDFGATTGRLRRLLVAAAENAAVLPDISTERTVLEQALAVAEDAKKRQDGHTGEKQLATQELKVALARAKDAGIQLQNAAKFKLGPRNEKLVTFQVSPLRPRPSRKGEQLKKKEKELQAKESDLLKREVDILKKSDERDVAKTAEEVNPPA